MSHKCHKRIFLAVFAAAALSMPGLAPVATVQDDQVHTLCRNGLTDVALRTHVTTFDADAHPSTLARKEAAGGPK
jgi:hypothetical protein